MPVSSCCVKASNCPLTLGHPSLKRTCLTQPLKINGWVRWSPVYSHGIFGHLYAGFYQPGKSETFLTFAPEKLMGWSRWSGWPFFGGNSALLLFFRVNSLTEFQGKPVVLAGLRVEGGFELGKFLPWKKGGEKKYLDLPFVCNICAKIHQKKPTF